MIKYKGSVAVITGAASGIGKALALKLAAQGCHLALVDKDQSGLEEVEQLVLSMGVKCLIENLDVADNQRFIHFANQVNEHFGGVDMIFNNAGVALIDSVENQTMEDFHWLMNINFWGVVHGTRSFLPYLKKSPQAYIVNVSSLFGLLSLPLQSAYNASKFAVRGFTEALKMEMAGTNISVHCVHPGGIKTNITNNAKISSKHVNRSELLEDFNKQAITTSEQAVEIILGGMTENKRRILVGQDAMSLDGVVREFPDTYEDILGFEKGVIEKRKSI
jgi:short-subunit dehydrogenase